MVQNDKFVIIATLNLEHYNFATTTFNDHAPVVELVDTQDLKSCDQQWSCGFKSRPGHLKLKELR